MIIQYILFVDIIFEVYYCRKYTEFSSIIQKNFIIYHLVIRVSDYDGSDAQTVDQVYILNNNINNELVSMNRLL